ncbi:RusA family crossover junction endodeoxyribonuclease [Agromyces aureus]|uniref:Holliday junction resolvase n=1 Tax=Agromyces aureus TaxID=453304 RepID=A0A191WEY6_9MICO|nr:RusA family crossover junction endodeoxyribonuclease [Agromyces aureus]ANJ26787.1 hypothetical protein ATC03_08740 [Agromyces aureus]
MSAWDGNGPVMPETVQTDDVDRVVIFVPGTPVPQGSKKGFARGRFVNIVDDNADTLKPWRATVAHHADIGRTFDGPLEVTLTFHMPRPQRPRWSRPAVKPDADKLARAILDGLTDGGLIADDARVVDLHIHEEYADTRTGVDIEVKAARS